jgi:hypothetical protein
VIRIFVILFTVVVSFGIAATVTVLVYILWPIWRGKRRRR